MFASGFFRAVRGPTASPGNPEIYTYSAGRYGISWDVTDPTAFPETRVGVAGSTHRLAQGANTWDSGGFDPELYVRYYKHGKVTEWVLGVDLP